LDVVFFPIRLPRILSKDDIGSWSRKSMFFGTLKRDSDAWFPRHASVPFIPLECNQAAEKEDLRLCAVWSHTSVWVKKLN
jgi:hypothetical protein